MNNGLRGIPLFSARDGQQVVVEPGRAGVVLIVVHSDKCKECREYVSDVWNQRADIFEWGERLIVVMREPSTEETDFGIPDIEVLVDANQKLPISGTGVMVTDEWGDVFHATAGHHRFLSASALKEWLRFIAMQCPECEQPEGAWREIQLHSDS